MSSLKGCIGKYPYSSIGSYSVIALEVSTRISHILAAEPSSPSTRLELETGAFNKSIQDYYYTNDSSVLGTAFSPDSRFLYSANMHDNAIWTHPVEP
jgi:hypothetical protein